MQLSQFRSATGLRSAPRQAPVVVVRPARCRVARITAEFVKQSDSSSPSKPAPVPAKPETNGAPKEVPAAVETPKPAAAQQQDALADLQDLRKLIDEVRLCLCWLVSLGRGQVDNVDKRGFFILDHVHLWLWLTQV